MQRVFLLLLCFGLVSGCDNAPKGDLPPLHPVKGKVVRGNQPVPGGVVRFAITPDTPETRDLLVNAEIKSDGTFELQTMHSVSQKKAPGAPAGTYQVTFTSAIGDQTQGGSVQTITLPSTYTVKPEPNEFTLDVGKK